MRRAVAARFPSSVVLLVGDYHRYQSWLFLTFRGVWWRCRGWFLAASCIHPIDSCMSSPIVISPRESPIVISPRESPIVISSDSVVMMVSHLAWSEAKK